ncbi:MAG: hypothetical protein FWG81_00490 [Betaproteobacteria bacterium]|nr:hypothetical protein [Betaproteobacteria bacterium]
MQDYSNIWKSYVEFCQRSWLDMSRFWFTALPGTSKQGADPGKKEAFSPFSPFMSTENWMTLFTPWMPRVDARIEPMMEEAARVSMRVFMPWHSDPFWVEALVSKQEKNKFPEDKKVIDDTPQNPAELEVTNAIKRSRTQD